VIGGEGKDSKFTYSIRLDKNEFTVRGDLVKTRWDFAVCCLRNVIYAIGGRKKSGKYRRSVEYFDLRKD